MNAKFCTVVGWSTAPNTDKHHAITKWNGWWRALCSPNKSLLSETIHVEPWSQQCGRCARLAKLTIR